MVMMAMTTLTMMMAMIKVIIEFHAWHAQVYYPSNLPRGPRGQQLARGIAHVIRKAC